MKKGLSGALALVFIFALVLITNHIQNKKAQQQMRRKNEAAWASALNEALQTAMRVATNMNVDGTELRKAIEEGHRVLRSRDSSGKDPSDYPPPNFYSWLLYGAAKELATKNGQVAVAKACDRLLEMVPQPPDSNQDLKKILRELDEPAIRTRSQCHKPPVADDQTFYVIKWKFHVAKVDDHYINYYTFNYSASNTNPCASPVSGQVCDHDVTSDKLTTNTCRYLVTDEPITKIVIRTNSIVPGGTSMKSCTCP